MKDRIARQVGMERARYLWMGTFHSVFSRILMPNKVYPDSLPNLLFMIRRIVKV